MPPATLKRVLKVTKLGAFKFQLKTVRIRTDCVNGIIKVMGMIDEKKTPRVNVTAPLL
jgi:hypothetical protein